MDVKETRKLSGSLIFTKPELLTCLKHKRRQSGFWWHLPMDTLWLFSPTIGSSCLSVWSADVFYLVLYNVGLQKIHLFSYSRNGFE